MCLTNNCKGWLWHFDVLMMAGELGAGARTRNGVNDKRLWKEKRGEVPELWHKYTLDMCILRCEQGASQTTVTWIKMAASKQYPRCNQTRFSKYSSFKEFNLFYKLGISSNSLYCRKHCGIQYFQDPTVSTLIHIVTVSGMTLVKTITIHSIKCSTPE